MKLISTLLIFFLLTNYNLFAEEDYEDVSSYEEYINTTDFVCSDYETEKVFIKSEAKYKEVEKIFLGTTYPKAENVLSAANGTYVETMNSIYRCAVINTQIVAMENFKKNLINKYDKVGDLKNKLVQKIDQKIIQVEQEAIFKVPDGTFDENGNPNLVEKDICTSPKIKETYQKINVLNNVTYETCKYLYYMDYLKEYYSDIDKLGLFSEDSDTAKDIEKLKSKGVNINTPGDEQNAIYYKIDNARKHAKEVFTMSFTAYTEYENNFPIHLLLQIIREDFIVFRKKLHEVLNPINQVVYKIVNCQNL